MRISTLISLLLLTACASTPAATSSAPIRDRTIDVLGGRVLVRDDERNSVTTVVAQPLARVWPAVIGVYADLGLRITGIDTTNHVISGERLRSRQPFLGKPLLNDVNCGETAGVPNVTRYEVNLQLVTRARGEGSGTAIETQVISLAKPSGTSGDFVSCSVTSRIAAALGDTIANRVR